MFAITDKGGKIMIMIIATTQWKMNSSSHCQKFYIYDLLVYKKKQQKKKQHLLVYKKTSKKNNDCLWWAIQEREN